MIYSIYCLSLLAFSTTTSFWTRSAMASFYGYGVGGKLNDPFYAMQKDDIGLDSKSYAQYSGFWFNCTFIPCLLFGGPLVTNLKKTTALGWATLLAGVAVAGHGVATEMW